MTESDRVDTVPPVVGQVPVASTENSTDSDGQVRSDGGGTPLGSRYLLHERLGRGATGTVYRATCQPRPNEPLEGHVATGSTTSGDAAPTDVTEVAVKVLREELADDPDVVARFLAERTTLVELHHPNLVRVRDLVAEGSTLAIVMDLVDGPDLRRWMRTAPPLPPAVGCRLLAQIAGALTAVHGAGVVHRDLKPENVLLSRVGTSDLRAHVTDFGVARPVGVAAARLTQHGQVVGTPAYLAPEVTAGTPAAPPADVYAFGVLAYELLAGCRPFADEQPAALAHAHATLTPGRLPGIDDDLWRVVASCLAKDPAARPTAEALSASLLDCATAIGDAAPAIPRQAAPPPAVSAGDSPGSGTPPPPVTPDASTPPQPTGSTAGRPSPDDPQDHLLTGAGTAPPPPRPPAEAAGGRRRRRLYVVAAVAAAAVALVAGGAIGVLALDRPPDREARPRSATTTEAPGTEPPGTEAPAESTTTQSPTTTPVPPAPLQVPNVAGLARDDACAALEAAQLGCSWEVNPTNSVRDPNLADDQTMAAGTSADPETTVTVYHPAGPDAVLHRFRALDTTTDAPGDRLRRWALAPDVGPGRASYDRFEGEDGRWEFGGELGRCYSTQVEGSIPLYAFTTPTPGDPHPDHHFYTAGDPGSANFERGRSLYPAAVTTVLCYVIPWDAPSGGTEVVEWTVTGEPGHHFYTATGEDRLSGGYIRVDRHWRTW